MGHPCLMGDPGLLANPVVDESDDSGNDNSFLGFGASRWQRCSWRATSRSCVSWMEKSSENGRILTILGS